MKKSTVISISATLSLLLALVVVSDAAVIGAHAAMSTCVNVMIPCLFPFFVVSHLLNDLGLPRYLGRLLQFPMALLFGVSGTGAAVFVLGILGGYPVGAAVISQLLRQKELSAKEAGKLLTFCNNSGPAFLIGAVGVGVFHSSAVGLLLYAVHVLSAVITGMFLSDTHFPKDTVQPQLISSVNLSSALPEAIGSSALQILQICGYVIFFGALTGILEELQVLSAFYIPLAAYTKLSLHNAKALCAGLLELGCGIGALQGTQLTPQSLAVATFLTGFGGLSVCLQTAGVLQGTGIPLRHHLIGRICCSGISTFLMYTLGALVL